MKNVVVISFFNSDNIGDLILSKELYESFKLKANAKKIDFVTGETNIIDKLEVLNENKIEKKSLKKKKIKLILKSNKFLKEIINLKNSIKCIKKIDWEIIEKNINESDTVIIGGGNMLMGLSYDFPVLFYKYIKLAKKYKKDIRVVSVGVGPFRNTLCKKIIKKSLINVNYITTRDKKSKKILEDITGNNNIQLSCDPAMLYENRTNNENKKDIAISVYPYQDPFFNVEGNSEKYTQYINELVTLVEDINKLLKRRVILFSTEINDYTAVKDVYNLLSNEYKKDIKIEYVNNLDDLINIYNKTLLLIGTRLHSIIIAYTQEIPVIGLSWQPKVDGFFEYINRESRNFKIDEIKKNSTNILEICSECIKNYDEEVNNIKESKRNIVKEFEVNLKGF